VKAYDLVELAGRNLREAVLRNTLTTLGVSVGVASLVAMLSLGVGLQELMMKRLGRSGLFDTVWVTSRQDFRTQDDRRADPSVRSNEVKFLDDKAREEFGKIANVAEVYPEVRAVVEMRFALDESKEPGRFFNSMAGLAPSARRGEAFDELHGSFFSSNEAEEAIIMGDFARELLGLPDDAKQTEAQVTKQQADQLMGKYITLRYAARKGDGGTGDMAAAAANQNPDAEAAAAMMGFSVERDEKKFKIVGIVTQDPYGGWRSSGRPRVFIPIGLAEKLNMVQPMDLRTLMRPGQGKTYVALLVRVTDPKNLPAVQDAIKRMGYSTYSIQDASKSLGRFFSILDAFLGIFGSLALAVASLGIVNTLVMAILERRREIGIMKALGASDIDVKKLFFVEAGAMGVLGGLLGAALGAAIGKIINFAVNIYLKNQDLPPENFWNVPLWLFGAALGFSVMVSLVAGLYPASRAAKLDPVQALRHD
jgi:putative ABC transport system permease protein